LTGPDPVRPGIVAAEGLMPKPKRKKVPPKPAPVDKDAGKVVWIKCRGRAGCEGQQSTLVWRKRSEGGGFNARYKCLTCGSAFHINT